LSLLQLQDQPEEAIRGLARAAELAGSQPDAPRVRLMQALVERGRFDEAAGPIRALLARNPAMWRRESSRPGCIWPATNSIPRRRRWSLA
jgi:hypothetical protein